MAKSVFFRTGFNYDADAASLESGLDTGRESFVQQHFAEECDINTIVRKFGLTGELPNGIAMPLSGDFTSVTDFQSAMNMLKAAEGAFMEVPAEVRARFGNDSARLIEFLESADNRDEAIKLGLIAKPVEKTRDAVQAIDELAKVLAPKA